MEMICHSQFRVRYAAITTGRVSGGPNWKRAWRTVLYKTESSVNLFF